MWCDSCTVWNWDIAHSPTLDFSLYNLVWWHERIPGDIVADRFVGQSRNACKQTARKCYPGIVWCHQTIYNHELDLLARCGKLFLYKCTLLIMRCYLERDWWLPYVTLIVIGHEMYLRMSFMERLYWTRHAFMRNHMYLMCIAVSESWLFLTKFHSQDRYD